MSEPYFLRHTNVHVIPYQCFLFLILSLVAQSFDGNKCESCEMI